MIVHCDGMTMAQDATSFIYIQLLSVVSVNGPNARGKIKYIRFVLEYASIEFGRAFLD